MVVVTVNGVPYTAERGTRLSDVLNRAGLFRLPCGGQGRCGNCRVTVSGLLDEPSAKEKNHLTAADLRAGIRLACCARVMGDCTVKLHGNNTDRVCVDSDLPDREWHPRFSRYGAAVDIGTTTMAACLYDTAGRPLAKAGCPNPQAHMGADVISRIEASMAGAQQRLATVTAEALDGLLTQMADDAGIASSDIDGLVLTGNTAMLHLLTGTPVEPLSHAPFAAQRLFDETVSASVLGLTAVSGETTVYLPPCFAAFVGADTVCALLADRTTESAGNTLLVDIGTNGEMALVHGDRLYVCSTAAGPAFEGAGIHMGMSGSDGAVDHVSVVNGALHAHVIGGGEPQGICGSGVVDAVAGLLQLEQLDETGFLEDDPAVIAGTVCLTQQDVRQIQLAKSAICAGIRTLLHNTGVAESDIQRVSVAGGFGSFLDIRSAGKIGLLPPALLPTVRVIGNAALTGASILLLDRHSEQVCRDYVRQATVVELSTDAFFADCYLRSMLFE